MDQPHFQHLGDAAAGRIGQASLALTGEHHCGGLADAVFGVRLELPATCSTSANWGGT
ncbi:MAG: hypothetical protein IPG16_12475 [Comamonadaceae bacterium]|nr:hypothetical protein [Comamonadaceae bacterium]